MEVDEEQEHGGRDGDKSAETGPQALKPIIAGATIAFSRLLVVTNSLWLYRFRGEPTSDTIPVVGP